MNSTRTCDRCGTVVPANAPDNLCLRCLFDTAVDLDEAAAPRTPIATPGDTTTRPVEQNTPPPVFGDYELLVELGRGGQGVVYRARHRGLGRLVALKTIPPAHLAGAHARERFRLEASTASRLDHPNIVPIYEVGERDGFCFYSMKLVEGGNLAQRIAGEIRGKGERERDRDSSGSGRGESLTPTKAVVALPPPEPECGAPIAVQGFHARSPAPGNSLPGGEGLGEGEPSSDCPFTPRASALLLLKVAHAVHHAHQRGVLHRDLKPSNVLLDHEGEPHVSDFGLARLTDEDSSLTLSQALIGTPAYLSPEVAMGGARQATVAADIYGLGAILYHLLTGQSPFVRATVAETLRAVQEEEPVPPREVERRMKLRVENSTPESGPESINSQLKYLSTSPIPADLETICLKCLEKEPGKRYGTAQELAADLTRFLRDEPILARPASTPEKFARWCRRKPALAGLWAAVFLLLVSVTTGIALAVLRDAATRRAEQREYFAGITLADNYVRIGDIQRALEVLTNCPPAHRHWEWGRLMFLCHQEISTLDAITNKVNSTGSGFEYLHAIANADRSRLVTVGEDGAATAWAMPSGAKQFTTGGSGRRIVDMAFTADGRTLALLDRDGGVQTWDAVEGRSLLDFQSDQRPARSIRFSPDGARLQVTAIHGATVFDARTGQRVATTPALPGEITRIALSADATRLATLDAKGKVQLWDAVTGELQRGFDGTFAANGRLQFTPDGRRLLIGDPGDGTSSIWNTETGERQCELKTRVEFADFSSDGSRVCVLSGDNVPRVWSTASGREILALKGHATTVRYAAFTPDGLQVTTVDEEFVLKTWRFGPGLESTRSSSANEGLVFSPDGKRLALTQDDDDATVWDVESGTQLLRLQGHLHRTSKVVFSPDGKRLYTGSYDKTVKIWNAETGDLEQTLRGHSEAVSTLALSPDGRTLATGADGVRLWDLASGAPPRLLAGNINVHVIVLAFRSDGRQLAAAYGPEGTYLWDPKSGTLLRRLQGHSSTVLAIAYSPNGRTLVTAGFDKQIHFWDPDTGRKLRTLRAHLKVYAIHFSPDGRRLITSTGEHRQNFARSTAQIWDVESGRELLILDRHASTIHCATFSPDGRRAATVDWTGVVRVWETFPWRTSDYPGDVAQALGERARLHADNYWKHRLAVDARTSRAGTNLPAGQRRRIDRAEFAARPADATARQLDLTGHYNALLNVPWIPWRFVDALYSDLSGLPTGLVQFAGTTFDVRGLIQVQGPLNQWLTHRVRPLPEQIAGIPVGQPITRLHALLAAIGREPDGTLIGAFRLHYPDGTTQEIPIRYGEHVRDWWSGEDASETLSHGSVVWRGKTELSRWRGGGMRVFASRWETPRPGAEVVHIDFVSKLTRSGPFLIALTIEP